MVDGEVPEKNNSNRKYLCQIEIDFPFGTAEVYDECIYTQANDTEKCVLEELFGNLWIVVGKGPDAVQAIIADHCTIKTAGIGKEFIRV